MLSALCREYNFTVFAVEFENPDPERIHWVRVPAFKRPLALLFLCYHLLAPLCYLLHAIRSGRRYDLTQMVESNLVFGDISYAHFCHRSYLKRHWPQTKALGIRRLLRWLDHWLHAVVESYIFRRVKKIVAVSHGLARELQRQYPHAAAKIHVIQDPVNLDRMRRPVEFDREAYRNELELRPHELTLVFVALGHYERKGLPLILEALRRLDGAKARLLVVGGEGDVIKRYQARAAEMGLNGRVTFFGTKPDIRPYLWISDAFLFPSYYEGFPLVSVEAAAAGLPLMVTPLDGVEEYLVDGKNGLLLDRSVEGVERGIVRLLNMSPADRARLGEQARSAVSKYSVENFILAWRNFYAGW
ncbi:MAG TPA: glycosyltransferase family 4 protein [Blastocatellia bacterium]|nr:glycosyltransferase family 4 protein [Blastocatellia bacterium]